MASGGRSDPIERKTQELIDALKESCEGKSEEEILGCRRQDLLRSHRDPLTDLLESHCQLYSDVLEAEAKARIQTHRMLLFGCRSLDMHYQDLVDGYQPQPSRTRDVLTDMLTRVCHIMTTYTPLFAFRPVEVGSHRDGTKTDDSDFDVVFVSLHRPREDSMERSSEDSTERSSEDSMERSSEDSTYRPREDYFVSGRLPEVSIVPVKGSPLYTRCEERGLLKSDGRLNVSEYRHQLSVRLSSVMSDVCSELGLSFGGWNRPHFGDFEGNGPAWSVVMDGVSVDITVAFTAPRDIEDRDGRKVMEEIAERVSSAVSSTVSSTVSEDQRPDWVNMGLVMLTDGRYDCQLSTSLIEVDVIRTVPQLQRALKICKVYRDQFFDLPGPDLTPFFRHLEGRVFKWLVSGGCDTLLRAVRSDPDWMVVDELGHNPKLLLLLATQRRPLTLDEDILEKLETIKQIIGGKWRGYGGVDPCLKSLVVSKPPKPIIKTISFVFKCLLLDKWLKENKITTERLVEHVMKKYSRLVTVCHPFLSSLTDPVDVFKFSSFYQSRFPYSRSFRLIHVDMLQQIVSRITPHTPTPPVSDPPTPPDSDPPTPPVSDPPTPPVSDPPIISDDDRQMEVLTDTRQQTCQQRMADWWRRCCCCYKQSWLLYAEYPGT